MGDKQNERGDFCGRPGPLCSIWDNEIAPARGNPVAGRGQSHCQPRAIEVPAAGTSSASRGYIECQPRVHRVPAAGTSSASRGHIECQPRGIVTQPLGIKFPAAGCVPSPWESYSQPLGIVFPALGNRVPSPWESCSQPLGIVFPSRMGIPLSFAIRWPALGHAMAGRLPCGVRSYATAVGVAAC